MTIALIALFAVGVCALLLVWLLVRAAFWPAVIGLLCLGGGIWCVNYLVNSPPNSSNARRSKAGIDEIAEQVQQSMAVAREMLPEHVPRFFPLYDSVGPIEVQRYKPVMVPVTFNLLGLEGGILEFTDVETPQGDERSFGYARISAVFNNGEKERLSKGRYTLSITEGARHQIVGLHLFLERPQPNPNQPYKISLRADMPSDDERRRIRTGLGNLVDGKFHIGVVQATVSIPWGDLPKAAEVPWVMRLGAYYPNSWPVAAKDRHLLPEVRLEGKTVPWQKQTAPFDPAVMGFTSREFPEGGELVITCQKNTWVAVALVMGLR